MPAKPGIHDFLLQKITRLAIAPREWPPRIELPRKVRDAAAAAAGQIAQQSKTLESSTMHPQTEPRYATIIARDALADGAFFYAVKTTGVYCRPSCAARPPRPENVSFYTTCAEAEAAGFRPCKRCKPNQKPRAETEADAVARACRMIESAEEPPALAALAAASGLSPFHFHRIFKTVTGVTPKAYAAAHRDARVKAALRDSASVTEAIYDAGYNSSARFYAAAESRLGMKPKTFRAGGAGEIICSALAPCAFGVVLVAATAKGICAISLGTDGEALEAALLARFPNAVFGTPEPNFAATVQRVAALVAAPGQGLSLPLDIRGTAFQQRVWAELTKIPPGQTATYTQIAARIGAPNAVRAVGSACAANPLAVAIPCHRALRKGGALAGYRWGLATKRKLLESEATSTRTLEILRKPFEA
jgi:AraC family transcriptional regulator of adaptative response/methylated-DNA-[protein]-cysteine methyltransferase